MRRAPPFVRYASPLLVGLLGWAACSGDPETPERPDTTDTESPTTAPTAETGDDTATDDTATDKPAPDVVQVIVLAGQSNMAGRASVATLPAQLRQEQADVRLFYSGGGALKAGSLLALQPGSGTDFGPEVTLGRGLADLAPDGDFVLIKHAVGGTTLFDDWDPTTGAQYETLTNTVTDGLQALVAEGVTPQISGFAWLQGEADVVQGRSAEEYAVDLTELIGAVRADFAGGDDVRFVVGRLSDQQFDNNPTLADGREAIQAAQDAVAESIANVAILDTDRLTLSDDRHYDAPSLVAMGTLFARALLDDPRGSDTAQFDFGLTGQGLELEEPGWTPLQQTENGSGRGAMVVDPATGWTIALESAGTNLLGRNRSPLVATTGDGFTLDAVYVDFITAWNTLTIGGLDPTRTYEVQVIMFDNSASDERTQTLTLVTNEGDVDLGTTDGPGPDADPILADDLAFSIAASALAPDDDGTLTLVCANSSTRNRCLTNGVVISEN